LYHAIRFLQAFVADVAKPIERDDRVHMEYVPTQVATEFVRVFGVGGEQVDGIRYRSSRGLSSNIVFFASPADVVGTDGASPDAWIEFVDSEVRHWD